MQFILNRFELLFAVSPQTDCVAIDKKAYIAVLSFRAWSVVRQAHHPE